MCLVLAGVLVVAGGGPGASGASVVVKQLLPGLDPVAMTMSLSFRSRGRLIRLAGFVGQDNDASAAEDVAGWGASRVVRDRVIRGVALVVTCWIGPGASQPDHPGCLGFLRRVHEHGGMITSSGDFRGSWPSVAIVSASSAMAGVVPTGMSSRSIR